MKNKVSFEVSVGSVNYNLLHPKSDIDKKVFYYPTFLDLYKGDKNSISSVTVEKDVETHDIRKLPSMLYKSNVNFIEVLFSRQITKRDELYNELYKLREEIARINLPYLFLACYKGMYERKMKEYDRDTSYINVFECEELRREKVNKHLMVAYRILDFLVRYAQNEFTSFASAIHYDDLIVKDKKMKEFLFSIRDGKAEGQNIYGGKVPEFMEIKRKEAEAVRGQYESKVVNRSLVSKIEKIVEEYVRQELQRELAEYDIAKM